MKTLALLFFCLVLSGSVQAQCLTDFTRLLPEPALDYTLNYGNSFALHDNYLAVGLPAHDSLGRITGLVYVYEKLAAGWKKVASLTPSDPVDGLQFGINVEMSSNYILVSGRTNIGGKVYLFKKPPTGWNTQTEFTTFTYPDGTAFGTPWYTGLNEAVDISDDEHTIAITDLWYRHAANDGRQGAVFVYHKQPQEEWDGNIVPAVLRAPEDDIMDFSRTGVAIHGDRVITGTPYSATGSGKLYIYRDPSGDFNNPVIEAGISGPTWPGSFWLGYYRFIWTEDGIFSAMATNVDVEDKFVVAFFEKPASGNWSDVKVPTCVFSPSADLQNANLPVISSNGQDLLVSYQTLDGNGYSTLVKKGPAGWCEPIYEDLDIFIPPKGQLTNRYGSVNAASQEHVAVGQLPHPSNGQANVGIKVLSHNADDTWSSEMLYPKRQTTAGHSYGRAILGFEDFLFVGAPYDGTVKKDAGAVYIYRKAGGNWAKTGKVLAPADDPGDNVFGTAIATNGTDMAIGAGGFGEHGRVFIYKRKANDWSEMELTQEIELPEDMLTVFAYGDNLAMSDDWLLIPYVQNNPARIMLAIYRNTGTQWVYSQVVEAGFASLNAKFTTKAVAIDGQTIVIGNLILEQNMAGQWQQRYVLSPSDPENAQIAPDFSHWVRNGSTFGHAVAISENSIFISAPTKDYGDTWDVGAVYVYTKKPWESWSSRTETARILPRVKDERELFGYSLSIFGNTLIAGAPGSDLNVDGTARNKPGRAYVFQTEDYFWREVTPLIDFTGDSFVKDYFGLAVALDETDFFISAPIEDIETGKLSGSVYVTPAPPIVKLVPPVCSAELTVDLFGYPFGGTWSGPGLIDVAQGVFDPAVAGVGEHLFTYKTESCTYEGKLRIVVEEPVQATLTVAPEHVVCENATTINIALGVQEHDGYSYLWYHRGDTAEPFFPLNAKGPSVIASSRGEYMAKVFNPACESFSPVVTVRNEEIELMLSPLERICQDSDEGIVLSAVPEGGIWSGPNVQNGRIFTKGLANGMHTVRYEYSSPASCFHTAELPVEIDRVPVPAVRRTTGSLCIEGTVNLQMTSTPKQNVTYTWQQKAVDAGGFSPLDASGVTVTVDERGAYRLEAKDGACIVASDVIVIDEHTFDTAMKPNDANLSTCDGAAQILSFSAVAGRTYEWYYQETEDGAATQVASGQRNEYSANVSGYYYAILRSGKCEAISPVKKITIHDPDEIWFPNIVTPNGDGDNETFTVPTDIEILDVRIMNRYGKVLFSGSRPEDWNVYDVTPGVYFSVMSYRTCKGEIGQVKGTVHVTR